MYVLTPQKYLLPTEQAHLENLLEKFRNIDLRNTTMLLFMLKTGARPSEVLNLTWSDIDLEKRVVYLRTLKRGNPRMLIFRDNLWLRFREMGPGNPTDRPFPISYNRFRDIWANYRPVKKRLHSLRHTFAMNVFKKSGHDLKAVQNCLGHRHLLTTCVYLQYEQGFEDQKRFID